MKVKNNCNPDGSCSKCHQCCTNFLPMSKTELKRIISYVKKHNIKSTTQAPIISDFSQVADMTCPFINNSTGECNIYEVRPSICRSFQCNKSLDYLEKNKTTHLSKFSTVDLRLVIYGEKMHIINYLRSKQS